MRAIMRLEDVIETRQDSVRASLRHLTKNVSLAEEHHDAASTQCLISLARPECLTHAFKFRAYHDLLHTIAHLTHTFPTLMLSSAVVLVQLRHNHAVKNKSSAEADYEQALVLLNISDTDTHWIRLVIICMIFEWGSCTRCKPLAFLYWL